MGAFATVGKQISALCLPELVSLDDIKQGQMVDEKRSHLEDLCYIAENITDEEDGGSSAGRASLVCEPTLSVCMSECSSDGDANRFSSPES